MRHVEVMLSSYKITLNNCQVYLFIKMVQNFIAVERLKVSGDD
jgi:hypothetical protein